MSGRGVLFVSVLAAAIAGPYFLSSSENRQGLNKWWESLRAASRGGSTDGDAEPAHSWAADAQLSDAWRLVSRLASEPPGVMPVGSYRPTVPLLAPQQLFRFDVTPSWIVNNWPRVTTQLTEGELEGLRVTVLTGTGVQDLTGSLTYYFDKQQQLQRILFRGYTGDPRPLVALLSQQYGLKLDPELGARVFTARWNGSPTHLLHIQHVPIVDAGNPRQQVQLDVELNLPGAPYGLSSQSQRLLDQGQPASDGQGKDAPPRGGAERAWLGDRVSYAECRHLRVAASWWGWLRPASGSPRCDCCWRSPARRISRSNRTSFCSGPEPGSLHWTGCSWHSVGTRSWGRFGRTSWPVDAPRFGHRGSSRARARQRRISCSTRSSRICGTTGPLAQALLPIGDTLAAQRLLRHGFREVGQLDYMLCGSTTFPSQPASCELDFQPYRLGLRSRLAEVMEQTYQQTMDCPDLDGLRNVQDVLDGYRHTGQFHPDRWLLVRHQQTDVGCLLLADHPEHGQLELVYMGLVPGVRGRGWGHFLVQHCAVGCRQPGTGAPGPGCGQRQRTCAEDSTLRQAWPVAAGAWSTSRPWATRPIARTNWVDSTCDVARP